MQLLGRATSVNVQKVLWALAELGIDFDREDMGGAFGGLDTEAYAAMNPNRRVPTLIDGDLVIWESNAVVRYLAQNYSGGALAGSTAAERVKADMWMEWFQNNCYAHVIALFYQTVRLPAAERDAVKRDAAAQALTTNLMMLEAHLAENAFVAGDSLSMGDIIIGSFLYRYYTMDFARADLPNLAAYYARLAKRDAYRSTIMTSYESLRAKDA